MSVYSPLQEYLGKLQRPSWKASFAEVERILGRKLPYSAYNYPAWWGNNAYRGRHSKAWLDIGWKTESLDLVGGTVTFKKAA
jgi:hypothetical protein